MNYYERCIHKGAIIKLRKEIEEKKILILNLAGMAMTEPYFSEVGSWDCAKSPCGLCCYNHCIDPVHDNCVFCGKPEERK